MIQSVDRAVRILLELQGARSLGLVELANRLDLANSTVQALIENIGFHCKDNNWTVKQSEQIAKFAKLLPGEQMVAVWNGVSRSSNIKNIQKMHKLLGKEVVAQVQASRNLGKK